jgi:dipeptidyl aminopeptidase/acylaminoacyl peptidase
VRKYVSALFVVLIVVGAGCEVENYVDYQAVSGKGEQSPLFSESKYIPDIETFMQIGLCGSVTYGPFFPSMGPQGSVFFISNMSGEAQLYRLDKDGWPYQLTVFEDGIDWFVLSHDAKLAIVGASVGGSEQSQMILIDARNGRAEHLTDTPEIQYGSVIWSNDDQTIYFRSNMENMRDFRLYKMDLQKREFIKLVDREGYNAWGDESPDGRLMLFYTLTSNVNSDLFLYDIESGEITHLTPHDGDILYDYAYFSADGNSLYLICNDNQQGLNHRATMDIKSRQITYVNPESPWNADYLTISRDRDMLSWVENEDGYGRLKLAEAQSGRELPAPKMDGIASPAAFSFTGKVAFAFASPTQTSDVWTWDWKAKDLKKVTHSIYAGVDPEIFTDPKLIKYKSFDGMEIPAFLYLPPNYSGKPIPFILDMHGGPGSQFRPYFIRHFQYLMLHGFGILAPNVRGSDGYGKDYLAMDNYKLRLNSVKDMKAGADWLIENGYTAHGMIGVKGSSYGGYMTMAAITEYPDFFSAASEMSGIVNFVSYLENTSAYRREIREAEYGPLSDKEFLRSISPINKAQLIKTPLLVIHGENDPRVPISEARQIIKAIQENGGTVDSLIFADEGHGVAKRENILITYRKMVDFFSKYLRPNPQSR